MDEEAKETRSPRRAARRLGERLTYANVMSTIAVFGVLAGGGAYAASQIGAEDIAKNAVRAKHVKKNQIRAKHIKKQQVKPKHVASNAIGSKHLQAGSVGSPQIQDGAVSAEKLATGASSGPPTGPAGGDLSGSYPNPPLADSLIPARAVGRVNAVGALPPGEGTNLTASNITHPDTGIYCLHDLPFEPIAVLATPDGAPSQDTVVTHASRGAGPSCPAGTQLTIVHRDTLSETGELADRPFFVVIF